jgi:hypothetical protein
LALVCHFSIENKPLIGTREASRETKERIQIGKYSPNLAPAAVQCIQPCIGCMGLIGQFRCENSEFLHDDASLNFGSTAWQVNAIFLHDCTFHSFPGT